MATRTHTFTPGGRKHSHRRFIESRLSGLIHKKLVYSLFQQLEAATAAVVQHCTLQLSPPCLKKVSELMIFLFFLNIVKSSSLKKIIKYGS